MWILLRTYAFFKMSLKHYFIWHIDIWKCSTWKCNLEKGKTGFYAIFLAFQPSSIKLRQHFSHKFYGRTSIHPLDVRACTLRTYVLTPFGRTCIEIFIWEKEKLCRKTSILWFTRVAYLPVRESSAENIAVLEAFEKAKSKRLQPIASQYVSWLLFRKSAMIIL